MEYVLGSRRRWRNWLTRQIQVLLSERTCGFDPHPPHQSMQSDGSRHQNVIHRGSRSYADTRYQFTNASTDILRIFTDTCDLLGVHGTRNDERNVSVSRRADVAFLDAFIGPKS